jgi:hypothetical protein
MDLREETTILATNVLKPLAAAHLWLMGITCNWKVAAGKFPGSVQKARGTGFLSEKLCRYGKAFGSLFLSFKFGKTIL